MEDLIKNLRSDCKEDPVESKLPEIDRADVIKQLTDHGTRIDLATQYADVFLEYMKATRNIAEYGIIIKHPRTGNPINNPYLEIRDRALRKLQLMRNIKADYLWRLYG